MQFKRETQSLVYRIDERGGSCSGSGSGCWLCALETNSREEKRDAVAVCRVFRSGRLGSAVVVALAVAVAVETNDPRTRETLLQYVSLPQCRLGSAPVANSDEDKADAVAVCQASAVSGLAL